MLYNFFKCKLNSHGKPFIIQTEAICIETLYMLWVPGWEEGERFFGHPHALLVGI